MLNFDKYVNEIIEERKNHTSLDCALLKIRMRHGAGKSCANTTCSECREDGINWLCEEYKPQFLKNGDGLKPGDWIMVKDRDEDKWQKRQFMCYFQSLDKQFVTLKEMGGWYVGEHECWEQARLLEEGE